MSELEFESLFEFIRNGMNVKQDKSGEGLPISRIETISDGTVNPDRVGFAGLRENQCTDWLLQPGDILFSHINSVEHIGKCAVFEGFPEKLVHGMNLLCLRPNAKLVDSGYAKYLIRSQEFRGKLASFINKAVNQASVSIGNLRTIKVHLPPLPEQCRIAAILDQAEALRAKRRAALAKLDTLAQSIFIEMFGDPFLNPMKWPYQELQSVIRKGSIITYGIVQAGEEFPGGVPYIKTGDIVNGEIRLDGLSHTDPQIASKFDRSRVETGEIVMSIRATVGTTALVPPSLDGANLTQGTARIAPGQNTNPHFLLTYIRSEAAQAWLSQQIKGATFREITLGRLREMPVLLPPLQLQNSFSRHWMTIETLKFDHRSSLSKLDALFASLQHRAFRGGL